MLTDQSITDHTRNWVAKVIIGHNFCPFAKRVFDQGSIHYEVIRDSDLEDCLHRLIDECQRLDRDKDIETSLLMFPDNLQDFDSFLDMLEIANQLLVDQGYEGTYQLANFHPDYCFADAKQDDPANYTNRSPYPMLHLIREAGLEQALEHYPNPETIPERNIEYARQLGQETLQTTLDACYKTDET